MAKYRSKMSLITRRITGGFVVHWDFFPLNHAIFHIHIFLRHYFSEVIWGNPELSWNNPRVFLDYQEKTVRLPQENSKGTRSFQGIFHEVSWENLEVSRDNQKVFSNSPEVFTEKLKFPGKTQEFPGKPQVSLGKTGIPG